MAKTLSTVGSGSLSPGETPDSPPWVDNSATSPAPGGPAGEADLPAGESGLPPQLYHQLRSGSSAGMSFDAPTG